MVSWSSHLSQLHRPLLPPSPTAGQDSCGPGLRVHRDLLSQPLCPQGHVPDTALEHRHGPWSPVTGTRYLRQLQQPQHFSGSAGLPLQAARQPLHIHPMGRPSSPVRHLPSSSSPVLRCSAPSTNPGSPREHSQGSRSMPSQSHSNGCFAETPLIILELTKTSYGMEVLCCPFRSAVLMCHYSGPFLICPLQSSCPLPASSLWGQNEK